MRSDCRIDICILLQTEGGSSLACCVVCHGEGRLHHYCSQLPGSQSIINNINKAVKDNAILLKGRLDGDRRGKKHHRTDKSC